MIHSLRWSIVVSFYILVMTCLFLFVNRTYLIEQFASTQIHACDLKEKESEIRKLKSTINDLLHTCDSKDLAHADWIHEPEMCPVPPPCPVPTPCPVCPEPRIVTKTQESKGLIDWDRIVIKMDSDTDGSGLIDWDKIVLFDNTGSSVEYDVNVNPAFNLHNHSDSNARTSSYPKNPLHFPWKGDGTYLTGRIIWSGSPSPKVGDTLLTLSPKTPVASMQLNTYKSSRSRHVNLEVTYQGVTYNIPKSQVKTTFD